MGEKNMRNWQRYITSQETNQCNLIKVMGIQRGYIGWWRSWKFRLDTGHFRDAMKKKSTRVILKRKLGDDAYYSASVSRSRPRSYFSSLPSASNHLSAAEKTKPVNYLVIKGQNKMGGIIRTWETSYTVFHAQWFAFSICVNFRNDDFVFSMWKCIREFFIYRCKVLKFSLGYKMLLERGCL